MAYRDVLAPAFPPEELNDEETLCEAYVGDTPGFAGTIALFEGEPVGVALSEHYTDSNIVLLSYLAVGAASRAQGIGRLIMAEALPKWQDLFRPVAIIAEVEDPRLHQTSVHGDPVKRLRFYERLGATLLPLPYFQPSLGPGLARVRGMFLICFGSRESLPTDTVTAYLDENIVACEGDGTQDAEFLALRDMATRWGDTIPLWPMSRYDDVPGAEHVPG